MPTYEYECEACGHEFEALQSMMEATIKKCPQCKKMKLHRLIGTGAGIIFKGSGFYETDYKKKDSPKGDSKSEGKNQSEAKPQGGKSHGCSPHCGCAS